MSPSVTCSRATTTPTSFSFTIPSYCKRGDRDGHPHGPGHHHGVGAGARAVVARRGQWLAGAGSGTEVGLKMGGLSFASVTATMAVAVLVRPLPSWSAAWMISV